MLAANDPIGKAASITPARLKLSPVQLASRKGTQSRIEKVAM
jgi:hypothetical protein